MDGTPVDDIVLWLITWLNKVRRAILSNESGEIESRPTSQVTFDYYGAFFNLLNFDFFLYDVEPTDPRNTVTMTSSAGGFLDLAAAFSGHTTMQTLSFSGSEWQNLTWLTFATTQPVFESFGEQILLDNIHFEPSTIPEPNTLALFALALFFLRHRLKDKILCNTNNV